MTTKVAALEVIVRNVSRMIEASPVLLQVDINEARGSCTINSYNRGIPDEILTFDLDKGQTAEIVLDGVRGKLNSDYGCSPIGYIYDSSLKYFTITKVRNFNNNKQ